nr:hypothetical protein CFP56_27021 [Quercus suber]
MKAEQGVEVLGRSETHGMGRECEEWGFSDDPDSRACCYDRFCRSPGRVSLTYIRLDFANRFSFLAWNGKGKAKDKEVGEYKWSSSNLCKKEAWHHEKG